MDLRRISDPLTQVQKLAVVPLAEVKLAARIAASDEDAMIRDDIEAAYDFLSGPDGWLNGCCLLTEEWEAFLPSDAAIMSARRWSESLQIPLRPLKRLADTPVVSVDYLDVTGSYVTVDPALYAVTGEWQSLVLSGSVGLPYAGDYSSVAYRLRFKAGFGEAREDIPSPLRKAIRMLAAHWFVNRETVGSENRKVGDEIRYGLRALAGRYRVSPDHS